MRANKSHTDKVCAEDIKYEDTTDVRKIRNGK